MTGSGKTYVNGPLSLPPTTIQTIEFADAQTDTVTAFGLSLWFRGDNCAGNYPVTLENEHPVTYT